jgi:hypothetical protein
LPPPGHHQRPAVDDQWLKVKKMKKKRPPGYEGREQLLVKRLPGHEDREQLMCCV